MGRWRPHATMAGTYTGIEPYGLFWSMVPVPDEQPQDVGVRRVEVEDQAFAGVLFEAAGPGPHPVVMVVTGSGGGLRNARQHSSPHTGSRP
jgi:hypothetical protein